MNTRPHTSAEQRTLIVGGGLAGCAAATVLAERGQRVTVLERESYLGGRAGAWTEHLPDGTPYEMERGFHAFFRQYYNLRAWLRRIDPDLADLMPLEDYPLLGPGGARESFTGLPKTPPLNVMALVMRTPRLKLRDLRQIPPGPALEMLAYERERTFARFDGMSAAAYLDSLRFPPDARRMLFNVFAHSFFNPEERMSAAMLLMMFHFYFLGNSEGLIFDVLREPFSHALWQPMARYLSGLGVEFHLGTEVRELHRHGAGWRATVGNGAAPIEAQALVLATEVPALRRLVEASPDLGTPAWRNSIARLEVTLPFSVLRIFYDRPLRADRQAFAGTTGLGLLDNVSVYERFEGESQRWAEAHQGSVVELHAYAVPEALSEEDVHSDLLRGLHELYPETRDARILHQRFLHRRDCPDFSVGTQAFRPGVATPHDEVCLAGDYVDLPYPTALMERAVSSGFEAANRLLTRRSECPEPILSIPRQGLLAKILPRVMRGAARLGWGSDQASP